LKTECIQSTLHMKIQRVPRKKALYFRCEGQSVNVVQGSNGCLLWRRHET